MSRPYEDRLDREAVRDLVLAFRAATRVDVYPTLWRLRLLLACRVWQPDLDTQIWQDGAGCLVGFALLWRRRANFPYVALEQFIRPGHATPELAGSMLAWAEQRAQAIASEQHQAITLCAHAFDPRLSVEWGWASRGYVPVWPNPTDHNQYLVRRVLPLPAPAAGYTIRKLKETEIEAYEAVYDFAPVTLQHRRELLASDEYCHLVLVGPDGAFGAYSECSVCRQEWELGGERIGWLDYIGTRPDQQRRGWGRAILLESLRQFQAWGADRVMLITVSSNTAALRLYESTGFERLGNPEPQGYEKQFKNGGTPQSPIP